MEHGGTAEAEEEAEAQRGVGPSRVERSGVEQAITLPIRGRGICDVDTVAAE